MQSLVDRLFRVGLVMLVASSFASCASTVDTERQTTPNATARLETAATWDPNEMTLTYRGVGGMTAGEILLADSRNRAAATGHDATLFVTTIKGREARALEHEFWALYINGEPATAGPGSAETSDSDLVVWRLEKYQ